VAGASRRTGVITHRLGVGLVLDPTAGVDGRPYRRHGDRAMSWPGWASPSIACRVLDPSRWPWRIGDRSYRAYGSDPELVARLARGQSVQGLLEGRSLPVLEKTYPAMAAPASTANACRCRDRLQKNWRTRICGTFRALAMMSWAMDRAYVHCSHRSDGAGDPVFTRGHHEVIRGEIGFPDGVLSPTICRRAIAGASGS